MVLFSEGVIGQKIGFYLKQRWASPNQNSDSTRTREFGDIDSTVSLESFIQKNLFVHIKKITICMVKFSLISITFILIEYID